MSFPTLLRVLCLSGVLVLLVLLFIGPARAEEEQTLHAIECAPTCFMVAGRELAGLVMANRELAAQLKAAEAERDKLKSIKGCAKLEVTEPPKLPPLKRERDL